MANMISNANAAGAVSPAYPGRLIRQGSSGSEVARVQSYLNALASSVPGAGGVAVDGIFGAATRRAVQTFQRSVDLPADGVVGPETWNALIGAYNRIFGGSADTNPGIALRQGSQSQDVAQMQRHLNGIGGTYTAVNQSPADSRFGAGTAAAVRRFQAQFGLSPDGIIGPATWAAIVRVADALAAGRTPAVVTAYGGTPLRTGASGDSVRFLQSYLNGVHGTPLLAVDGRFGQATAQAVKGFQSHSGLAQDGVAGPATWARLVAAYNAAMASRG